MTKQAETPGEATAVLEVRDLDVRYGDRLVVSVKQLSIVPTSITALFGPSGCGKSVLLKALSGIIVDERDSGEPARVSGHITYQGQHIEIGSWQYRQALRKLVVYVPTRAHPFPLSIRQNIEVVVREVVPSLRGAALDAEVQAHLEAVDLWDEVAHRLDESAARLSTGQSQRLCIARALARHPAVLLLDEPTAFLDWATCAKIEDWLSENKRRMATLIVTHNMPQAARVSQQSGLILGEARGTLVEFNSTAMIFTRPKEQSTEDYITGRIG